MKNLFDELMAEMEKAKERELGVKPGTNKRTVGFAVETCLKLKGCPKDVTDVLVKRIRGKAGYRVNDMWDTEIPADCLPGIVRLVTKVAVEYLDVEYPDAWFRKNFCGCNLCTGTEHNKGFE